MTSNDIDIEKIKHFTLKVVSEISEEELGTVTLPVLREKVAESMEAPVENLMGKEVKAIIMETFQDFLLSKSEAEEKSESVKEDIPKGSVTENNFKQAKSKESKMAKSETKTKPESKKVKASEPEVKSVEIAEPVKPSKPVKPIISAKAAKIEKLKSYVFKCGVRKVWKNELDGLNENQCIAKLQTILEELGMEGNPSLEKCKAIKKRREFEAELKEIDVSNIIEGKRRKTSVLDKSVFNKGNKRGVIVSESEDETENKSENEFSQEEEEEEDDDDDDDDDGVIIDLKALGDSESD